MCCINVSGVKRRDLIPHVEEHVEKGSNVYTDAFRSLPRPERKGLQARGD